ncbi:unnamed protein product [Nesidiocoris tenuis]|uniref:Uncharacterized protein n=1 Tax=Nesidiocoris tenuis TaxID=355587 RepID=A0A6H5G0Y8_9HEMI|nr:unnamed protein product [Nesidiocoris tenuis]
MGFGTGELQDRRRIALLEQGPSIWTKLRPKCGLFEPRWPLDPTAWPMAPQLIQEWQLLIRLLLKKILDWPMLQQPTQERL